MSNPKWLERGILFSPNVILCVSEKDYLRECAKLNCVEPLPWLSHAHGASTHTLHNIKDGSIACIVTIDQTNKKTMPELAAILAHESVHVAQNGFEEIGEKYPGNEIEAYAVQYILLRLLESYEKQVNEK